MTDKFLKLNKQIASFMLVTFALAGLSTAAEKTTQQKTEVNLSFNEAFNKIEIPQEPSSEYTKEMRIIAMYAAPQIPIREENTVIYQETQKDKIMMKYASPDYLTNKKQESKTVQKQQMMLMYAAPEYFDKDKKQESTKKTSKWQKFLNKFKRNK